MDRALALILACSQPAVVAPVPSQVEVLLEAGDVHLAAGRLGEAKASWVQAAGLEHGNARALARQGWLEWLGGKRESAIRHLEAVVRLNLPESERVLAMARLGWLRALGGEEATELLAVQDELEAAPYIARLDGGEAVLSWGETMVVVEPERVLATGNVQPVVLLVAGLASENTARIEAALAYPVGLTVEERRSGQAAIEPD